VQCKLLTKGQELLHEDLEDTLNNLEYSS
jgi:hypothetical protein